MKLSVTDPLVRLRVAAVRLNEAIEVTQATRNRKHAAGNLCWLDRVLGLTKPR